MTSAEMRAEHLNARENTGRSWSIFERLLFRLHRKIQHVRRVCYACWQPIEGTPIVFRGKPYCSRLCVPTILWREDQKHEADRLDLARKAGL